MVKENYELYVQITDKCNYICENCFGACAPYRNNIISNDVILALKKMTCKIDKLYIYGGEPTLYLDKVNLLIEQNLSKNTVLITNGWWAKSEEEAKKMIIQLSEMRVTEIVVSKEKKTNKYHFYKGIPFESLKEHENVCVVSSEKCCGEIFTPHRVGMTVEDVNRCMEEHKIYINLHGDISFSRLFNHRYIGNILDEYDNTFFKSIS